MKHENYTGKIKDYIDGIERDLANVTENEGHNFVKDSILEQAKCLADIAVRNKEFLVMLREEFPTIMPLISENVPPQTTEEI